MMNTQNKKIMIPFLITLVGAALLLLTIFMPFVSATDDYKESLMEYEDTKIDEIDLTCKQAVNMSLIECMKIYNYGYQHDNNKDNCMADMIVISAIALCSLITLIFAAFKKSVGVIIFDVFTLIAVKLLRYDFEDRRVVGYSYEWGFGSYMMYILITLIIVGAVCLFIEKRKMKKAAKAAQNAIEG